MAWGDPLGATRRLARRLFYEARSIAASHPVTAVPLAGVLGRGHGRVFGPDTELVIDGYQRSGNTFAVAAFAQAQGRDVRVAHHVHSSGHAIAALEAGLPVLVLIREPEDAVIGWVVHREYVTIGQALRAYRRYYRPLLDYRQRAVVADFREVTGDFGGVIRKLNERFGTEFVEFDHSEANVRQLFLHMEWHRRAVSSPEEVERLIGRPSSTRADLKERVRPDYRQPRYRRSRAAADRLYRAFTSDASTA